tara:strand:- start:295 stop:618 length:324 start_codon:yes stop_codon:yes gene_type:complete
MTWFDIIKRGYGMGNRSKKLVDEVMLEVDEPLNIRAIMNLIHEKLEETKNLGRANRGRYMFPTTQELQYYLSKSNKYQKGAFDSFTGRQLSGPYGQNYEMKYWKGME